MEQITEGAVALDALLGSAAMEVPGVARAVSGYKQPEAISKMKDEAAAGTVSRPSGLRKGTEQAA